ncbi:MAG: hypothetical protein ACFE0Q_04970 [Anaerolineae bacterium]
MQETHQNSNRVRHLLSVLALVVLIGMMALSIIIAFGNKSVYVLALVAVPLMVARIWEEFSQPRLTAHPQRITQKSE